MANDLFQQFFLICATPRVGSTLFCCALKATGVAGDPVDWFDPKDEEEARRELSLTGGSRAELLAQAFSRCRSPTGIGGTKIMWGQVDLVLADLRQLTETGQQPERAKQFGTAFRGCRAVHLSRRNMVRAAISHWLAITTNQWMWYGRRPRQPLDREILNDPSRWSAACSLISAFHAEAHLADINWPIFLKSAQIESSTIYYEDWTSDPAGNIVGIAETILGLEVPSPVDPSAIPLVRQASEDTDLIERMWIEETGGCRYCH